MIHLGATPVNGVPRSMSFIQNLLLECCFLWHNQSILEPYDSLSILTETSFCGQYRCEPHSQADNITIFSMP
jgi:hypothetical protein